MKNFVILFIGQEGSSAIIESLGLHPMIYIVGFENLDEHSLIANFDGYYIASIEMLLENAFKLGAAPGLEYTKDPSKEQSVGFKWRPFGGESAVRAIARNNCVVFFLIRENALRRALSIIIGLKTRGKQHLQFDALAMSQSEKENYIAEVNSYRVEIHLAELCAAISEYTDQLMINWLSYAIPLKSRGTSVLPITYEDYCINAIKFINNITAQIGVHSYSAAPPLSFVKIFRDDVERNVINFHEIAENLDVKRALIRHKGIIGEIRDLEVRERTATSMPGSA